MAKMRHIEIGNVTTGNDLPLVLIAGPCVLESRNHALEMSHALVEMCARLGIGLIYKSSFDKANRTALGSDRGVGLTEGLPILAEVRETYGCPVLTDVHAPDQCAPVAEAVDVLQIPAFLCRQTDLLGAVAATGKPVNVKKGQFLSPAEMRHVVDKLVSGGCDQIMLTERGTFFGYHRLVNDFVGLGDLIELGRPVCFDVTHSTQLPGGEKKHTGGRPDRAPMLARAAVAAGVAAIFVECHPDPRRAASDGSTMQPLQSMSSFLKPVVAIRRALGAETACPQP